MHQQIKSKGTRCGWCLSVDYLNNGSMKAQHKMKVYNPHPWNPWNPWFQFMFWWVACIDQLAVKLQCEVLILSRMCKVSKVGQPWGRTWKSFAGSASGTLRVSSTKPLCHGGIWGDVFLCVFQLLVPFFPQGFIVRGQAEAMYSCVPTIPEPLNPASTLDRGCMRGVYHFYPSWLCLGWKRLKDIEPSLQ